MDVSENSSTPKSSILIGFSIINHPFWGILNFWKHPCILEVFGSPTCIQKHIDSSRKGKLREEQEAQDARDLGYLGVRGPARGVHGFCKTMPPWKPYSFNIDGWKMKFPDHRFFLWKADIFVFHWRGTRYVEILPSTFDLPKFLPVPTSNNELGPWWVVALQEVNVSFVQLKKALFYLGSWWTHANLLGKVMMAHDRNPVYEILRLSVAPQSKNLAFWENSGRF